MHENLELYGWSGSIIEQDQQYYLLIVLFHLLLLLEFEFLENKLVVPAEEPAEDNAEEQEVDFGML